MLFRFFHAKFADTNSSISVTDSQTIAQLTFQNTTNAVSRTPAYTPGGNFTYSHLQQEDEGIRLEKSNIMLLGEIYLLRWRSNFSSFKDPVEWARPLLPRC